MQKTQSKAITPFLLALVLYAKVNKTQTSFLEVWYSCLNNGSFYCSYNTKLGSNPVFRCQTIPVLIIVLFFISFIQFGNIKVFLTLLILLLLSATVLFFFAPNFSKKLYQVIKIGRC